MAFRRKRLINTSQEKDTKVILHEKHKKSWGKRERIFVLVIVLGSSIGSFLLAFVSRQGKLPGLPRLSSETFGLSDTTILTKSEVSPSIKKRDNEIIVNFSEKVSNLSGIYAFKAIDLETGDAYGINENEQMQAASLIKLPVMTLLLKKYDEGKVNLDTVYILKNKDKVGGSGSLIGKPEGTKLTYKELLKYMGNQSDNTAFNVIRNKFGDEEIQGFIDSLGMSKTEIKENLTSPDDIALLFRKLYEGSMVSTKSRDLLLGYLTDTIYEEHLVKGIPDDVRVAHKYGKEVHVVNDAGVVFGKNPYVVVIMTSGVVETEADAIFPTLSKIIYDGQNQ